MDLDQSIYRTDSFATNAVKPDVRPMPLPLNRAAIDFLVAVNAERRLTDQARALANDIGIFAIQNVTSRVRLWDVRRLNTDRRREAAASALECLVECDLLYLDDEDDSLIDLSRRPR